MKNRTSYYPGRLRRALGEKEFQRIIKLYDECVGGYSIKPIGENEIKFYNEYLDGKATLQQTSKKFGFKTSQELKKRMGAIQIFITENKK